MLISIKNRGQADGCCSPARYSTAIALLRRCLLDTKPRQFSPGNAAILNNFSELVTRELEAAWAESTTAEEQLARGARCYRQPYLIADMAQKGGQIMYISKAAQSLTGKETFTNRSSTRQACWQYCPNLVLD